MPDSQPTALRRADGFYAVVAPGHEDDRDSWAWTPDIKQASRRTEWVLQAGDTWAVPKDEIILFDPE